MRCCASMWPRVKKAIEFAWVPGGWDANRDGVMEGVQHNTYDVEFYGPNPLCGIYYLGALARERRDGARMGRHRLRGRISKLFEQGSRWIDANLFNGEYLRAESARIPQRSDCDRICAATWERTILRHPEYQVGGGCLVDQLIGQYLADVAGLGPSGVAGKYSHDSASPSTSTTTSDSGSSTTTWSAPMR